MRLKGFKTAKKQRKDGIFDLLCKVNWLFIVSFSFLAKLVSSIRNLIYFVTNTDFSGFLVNVGNLCNFRGCDGYSDNPLHSPICLFH